MLQPTEEVGIIPLYFGFGARGRFGDDDALGARAVIGISLLLEEFPMDVFFEIAPIVDVLPDPGTDINVGIGARYYFR